MNFKNILFLFLLASSPLRLFCASDNTGPTLLFGTPGAPIPTHKSIPNTDPFHLTEAIKLMSEERAIKFFEEFKNLGGEITWNHAEEAAKEDKTSARERKPKLCKLIIDFLVTKNPNNVLTDTDFRSQSHDNDIAAFNMYLCLGYKPDEKYIKNMIKFKQYKALQLCLDYDVIPKAYKDECLVICLINRDFLSTVKSKKNSSPPLTEKEKNQLASLFKKLPKEKRQNILYEHLDGGTILRNELNQAHVDLEEIENNENSAKIKSTTKITGNILIPCITALLCFSDYYFFKPRKDSTKKEKDKTATEKIGTQETEAKKTEKETPSKLKAYLSDLKQNPLNHKKFLISLPLGICSLVALNII